MNQTPHSRSRDDINFVFIAVLLLITVMAFSRCSTYRGAGCQQHAHMTGY